MRNCRRIRIAHLDMDWDWHTMPLATCAKVVACQTMADYTLTYWCEGMGSTNIVIRNCTFEGNCTRGVVNASYSLGADISAWIGVPPGVEPEDLWRPFVSSILVEGCTFRDSLGYFADIRCGERFTFRNNRIEDTGRRADRRETSGSAHLETVHGVLFENNVFIRPAARTAPTVDIAPDAKNVFLRGNRVSNVAPGRSPSSR